MSASILNSQGFIINYKYNKWSDFSESRMFCTIKSSGDAIVMASSSVSRQSAKHFLTIFCACSWPPKLRTVERTKKSSVMHRFKCSLLSCWLEDGADKAFDAIKEISHGEKVSASNIFFAIQFLVGIDNTFQIVGQSAFYSFGTGGVQWVFISDEWMGQLFSRCNQVFFARLFS